MVAHQAKPMPIVPTCHVDAGSHTRCSTSVQLPVLRPVTAEHPMGDRGEAPGFQLHTDSAPAATTILGESQHTEEISVSHSLSVTLANKKKNK